MVKVQVVYTQTCPFCPSAKELFRSLKREYKFDYEEIDAVSEKGQQLVQKYSIMSVPTVIVNDTVAFIGVPSREKAIAAVRG